MYDKLVEGDETTIQALWDMLWRYSWQYDDPTVDFFRQDFVNEATLQILDKLDSFESRAKFSTWAIAVFKNLIQTKLRAKKYQTTYNELEYPLSRINDDRLFVEQIFNLVVPEIVTEANFHMLIDYYALGRTAEEVCLEYGVKNVNALYIRLHRTKRAIHDAISTE